MKLPLDCLAGVIAGVAAVGLATTVFAAEISGAGSTFALPIEGKWAREGAGPATIGADLSYIKTIIAHAAAIDGRESKSWYSMITG